MKEYFKRIDEAFANGISPVQNSAADSSYLAAAVNMIPTKGGLETLPFVDDKWSSLGESYPFPQAFKGQQNFVLVGASSLWNLSATYVKSAVSVYNATLYNPLTALSFTATTPWSFAELHNSYFLACEQAFLFKTPAFSAKVAGSTTIVPNSVCTFRDRIVLGGLSGMSGANWTAVEDLWLSITSDYTDTNESIGSNYLFWGMPVGGSFDYPFTYELAALGLPNSAAYSAMEPHILDAIKTKQMGFSLTPARGAILKVLPLGDALVVYAEDCIAIGFVEEQGGALSIRYSLLMSSGVSGAGSVAGSSRKHYFTDKRGQLWSINSEFGLEKLGFYSQLTGTDSLVLSYLDQEDFLFASTNDSTGAVLTSAGMGQTSRPPTSVVSPEGSGFDLIGTRSGSSADLLSSSSWIVEGTWENSGGSLTWDEAQSSGSTGHSARQVATTTVNTWYRIKYTVGSISAGSFVAPVFESTALSKRTAAGTYVEVVKAVSETAELEFSAPRLSSGSIHSISLRELPIVDVQTGIEDFGTQARKMLCVVEVGMSGVIDATVSVLWRNKSTKSFSETPAQRANTEGFVFPNVTAKEFKVRIRGYSLEARPDGSDKAHIVYSNLRYKTNDKRGIRGAMSVR